MYIAIAGNIGSGKTTLTQILTKRYDAKCYLEECDNPYIGDFYEDMNRWAISRRGSTWWPSMPPARARGCSARTPTPAANGAKAT